MTHIKIMRKNFQGAFVGNLNGFQHAQFIIHNSFTELTYLLFLFARQCRVYW